MVSQIFTWWLVAQAFGLAGLPLAGWLYRALPDRGYAFAKPLGLLLSGYLAWLIAMLGLAPFGAVLLVASMLLIGGVGLLVNRRTTNDERRMTNDERAVGFLALGSRFFGSLRRNWKLVLAYEALFALALIVLALLRSRDFDGFVGPNPWNTERPMDYALFNAIRRSSAFPPHDPWLAGYSINYYYFGYMLMAAVALLSGLDPAVGYNLSLALIFALAALGVAGLVYNLIGLTENRRTTTDERQTTNDERQTTNDQPSLEGGRRSVVGGRIVASVLTVVLVLFAANQGGALQLITGTPMAVALDSGDLWRAVVNGLGPREPLTLSQPFHGDYFDGTTAITPSSVQEAADGFNYWNSTRAVWDTYIENGQPTRHYAITEFPFFSFWLGDMHPHVMALPFGLLAMALALQALARPAAPTFAMGRRGWLELALTGIVLGSLYAINSWDFPTYLLMYLGALLLLHVRLARPLGRVSAGSPAVSASATGIVHQFSRASLRQIWWSYYVRQAVLVLAASLIMLVPFHLTFKSLVARLDPLIDLPILASITRTLGLVARSHTTIGNFLVIFGLFLVPTVAYVFAQGRTGAGSDASSRGADRSLRWIILAALLIGPLIGFPMLVLLPLAIYAAQLAAERAEQPAAAFALWAFAVGCLICFGTDVVYIRDVFEGLSARLNTIFKFYYQAWLIWGMLAGYALWWLVTRPTTNNQGEKIAGGQSTRDHESRVTSQGRNLSSIVYRLSSIVLGLVFALLLIGALVYPWLTAGRSLREKPIVGLAGITPRQATPEGAASIDWLRANVPGNAVILEAVGGAYNTEGFGGVSASTGLATVLGWPGHEDQWRGGDPGARAQIGPRQEDVTTIYSTTSVDSARALLQKYKVGYIYVGALERATFPPAGLDKLAQLGEPVFQQGDVTIYRVSK